MGECASWGFEATVVDLKEAYDAVVVRRKDARDRSERWLGVRSVESSEVREPSCWPGIRKSDVDEVGKVEYLSESVLPLDQPCRTSTAMPPRTLEEENAKELRHPLPLLHPNGYLNLTMSQLYCRKEEGSILKTQILNAFLKARRKLLLFAAVVTAVVLHLSSSRVPVNLHIIFCTCILVFRFFS